MARSRVGVRASRQDSSFGLGQELSHKTYPEGPKYPNMEYICFCMRNRNYDLKYILHIWVLAPLGIGFIGAPSFGEPRDPQAWGLLAPILGLLGPVGGDSYQPRDNVEVVGPKYYTYHGFFGT